MKVCVFEWISGGGCRFDQISANSADSGLACLLDQGQDMLKAVVEDFNSLGHEVVWLRDSQLEIDATIPGTAISIEDGMGLQEILVEAGGVCDAILLIAPETGGRLLSVCNWLHDVRDRLISPDLDFIRLTGDKEATCHRLSARGVPVPKGCRQREFKTSNQSQASLRFPLVLKPVDGAGSEQIRLIRSAAELNMTDADVDADADFRIEEFVPGVAASVSAICFGDEFQLLPATQQIFDAEPIGHYVGAGYPLPTQLAERSANLAAMAIRALPPTRGYIGIDLVLSDSSSEQDCLDLVIEVNPRLTTSYLTLRQICGFNIAGRMLQGLL